MVQICRLLLLLGCLALPRPVAAAEAALFRLFLLDGSALVSYGEFVRLGDEVLFSMPVGGRADQPRLHVATIRAALVDWARTDHYAASVRYQRYAETRGEADFLRLSNEVADALNAIASSADRRQALAMAEQTRQAVASWPAAHYGYRHQDVREIVSVLDQAISTLRAATGQNPFELSLVALGSPPELEPVLGMPTPREQMEQTFQLSALVTAPAERVALMQSALMLIEEAGRSLPARDVAGWRRDATRRIKGELSADKRYADLSTRMMAQATSAAQRADVRGVEQVLARVPREDARLGRTRPQVVQALGTSIQDRIVDAQRLRLLRDQWALRRPTYVQYQRSVGSSVLQLTKSTAALEAIRRLDGPDPDKLLLLQSQLSGGAAQLERLQIPEYLRDVHERLIGAWRFAENAARARFNAVSRGDSAAAWEASSSAAGALMMLGRVQQDLQALQRPPALP